MIGLILAAGAGRRLRPYTDTLPKALVPLDDSRSVMDLTLRNFAEVGLSQVAIVVGYQAQAVHERLANFEKNYGLKISLVHNDKAEEWNNCYSLWCARELLTQDVVLANGDTIHPATVDQLLIEHAGDDILLAVDSVKVLGDEEMKVQLDAENAVTTITKLMDPQSAAGEYIGVSRIPRAAGPALIAALEATWQRDPNLYYEDGFQELINRGGTVRTAAIGDVPWIEVDTLEDLARAREIVCHY